MNELFIKRMKELLKNDFDAETLVKTLKDAGFKKLIVTAKHHDGFCMWDTKYSDYKITAEDCHYGSPFFLAGNQVGGQAS